MKKLIVKFIAGNKQEIICEDYDISNGCLYLIKVDKVNDIKVQEDKHGRILIIHNMQIVHSIAVEWLD